MINTLLLVFALQISCRALRSPVTDQIKIDGNVTYGLPGPGPARAAQEIHHRHAYCRLSCGYCEDIKKLTYEQEKLCRPQCMEGKGNAYLACSALYIRKPVGWVPWHVHCRMICEFCRSSDKFDYGVVRLCHPECMDQGTRECKNDPQCKEGGNYRKCRLLWSHKPGPYYVDNEYQRGHRFRPWNEILRLKPSDSSRLDPEAKWGLFGPVFCKNGSFAYAYRIWQDVESGDKKGLTHVTLYCINSQGDTDYIESGYKTGSQLKKLYCPHIKRTATGLSDLHQFLRGFEGIWGGWKEGMISFNGYCDLPDPSFWYRAKEQGMDNHEEACKNSKLNRARKGQGTARASTYYSDGNKAIHAFSGPKRWWHSKRKKGEKDMPQYIVFTLDEPTVICRISWGFRKGKKNAPKDCPRKLFIFGSNNSKSWSRQLYHMNWLDVNKFCVPGKNITKYFPNKDIFKEYTIQINDVKGRSKTKKYAVLSDVQFFGPNDNEKPEPKLIRHNHIYYKNSETNPKYEKGKFMCPWGQGICGINTSGDNEAGKTSATTNESGINEVKIFCCAFPEDMMPDY